MDTTQAYPFERKDGTKVLSIRLKSSAEEYGVNAQALEMPDSVRERYMKNSVWLTIAEKNDTMSALISVAIPTMEYMDRGAKRLPYVSVVHPQEFSGDMLMLTVDGKYTGRYLFEHGIPDAEREPLTVKIWDKVSTKGDGEEDDYPCGWYEHWKELYWLDEVVVTPPKDQNEEVYPSITPYEDPALFCMTYSLMCENCERCGYMKIDCICTHEVENEEESEGGGSPPPTEEGTGNEESAGGENTDGDNTSDAEKATPKYFPNTGVAKVNTVLVKCEDVVTNTIAQSLIKDGKIKLYVTSNPALTKNDDRACTVPKDSAGNYMVFINHSFADEITVENIAMVVLHELAHIIYFETMETENLDEKAINELHHKGMMAPNSIFDTMIREYFPDREESFYEAMRYAGSRGSAAYNSLDDETKSNIDEIFKENKIK